MVYLASSGVKMKAAYKGDCQTTSNIKDKEHAKVAGYAGQSTHARGIAAMGQDTWTSCKPADQRWLEARLSRAVDEDDADGLAMDLATCRGFGIRLSEMSTSPNLVPVVVKLLIKASKASWNVEAVTDLMTQVVQRSFLTMVLIAYLRGVKKRISTAESSELILNSVSLLQILVQKVPTYAAEQVQTTLDMINAQNIGDIITGENRKRFDEDMVSVVEILKDIDQQRRRREEMELAQKTKKQFPNEEKEPPNNFRNMQVIPSEMEMKEMRPFLRANVLEGSFKDTEDYLDRQFRLLREDFVRPLREGIQDYRAGGTFSDNRSRHIPNIRVYEGCRVLGPVFSQRGVHFRVALPERIRRMKRIALSRRLIYGSLVCVSVDQFRTWLFASVEDRDKMEESGKFTLKFHSDEADLQQVMDAGNTLVMIESGVYFEAYRPVLRALQLLDERSMPFQQYFVHTSQVAGQVDPPRYLREWTGETRYNLQPLLKVAVDPDDPRDRSRGLVSDVRDFAQWPDREEMTFDEAQLRAVQHALTREVAITQGPPGTGTSKGSLLMVTWEVSDQF